MCTSAAAAAGGGSLQAPGQSALRCARDAMEPGARRRWRARCVRRWRTRRWRMSAWKTQARRLLHDRLIHGDVSAPRCARAGGRAVRRAGRGARGGRRRRGARGRAGRRRPQGAPPCWSRAPRATASSCFLSILLLTCSQHRARMKEAQPAIHPARAAGRRAMAPPVHGPGSAPILAPHAAPYPTLPSGHTVPGSGAARGARARRRG